MDLQRGDVIYIDFPHPSFKWENGLKVVLELRGTEILMSAINEKGEAEQYENGEYMISITGKGNKGITKTNMKYTL